MFVEKNFIFFIWIKALSVPWNPALCARSSESRCRIARLSVPQGTGSYALLHGGGGFLCRIVRGGFEGNSQHHMESTSYGMSLCRIARDFRLFPGAFCVGLHGGGSAFCARMHGNPSDSPPIPLRFSGDSVAQAWRTASLCPISRDESVGAALAVPDVTAVMVV